MTALKHSDLWRAIDELAEVNGLSASALARAAGLDATTFNKSKRTGPDGRKRWPSTESLSNILGATKTSLEDFVSIVAKGGSTKPAANKNTKKAAAKKTTKKAGKAKRR